MNNPADPFKKALTEATKVIADDPELSVTYSVDPSGVSGEYEFGLIVSRFETRMRKFSKGQYLQTCHATP